MRVNTVSLKLGVRIDSANVKDGNIVMNGFAGMMPCETVVTPKEAIQMAKLCLKPAIIKLCLGALFVREPTEKKG